MRADLDTHLVSVGRERAVADLARRQYGVISRSQARDLGMSPSAIARRVQSRRWWTVHRGVYAVGSTPLADRGRWLAGVLAAGSGAVLSHRSAAALWGISKEGSRSTHVSASVTLRRRRDLVVHRVATLADEDRQVRDEIAVTSVARTLLDLAAASNRVVVARAVDEADRLQLLVTREVTDLLGRMRGQRGSRRLSDVIALHTIPMPTRSELERRFLDLVTEAGLPLPAVNAWVAGLEVDAVWYGERIVVELDGWAFHRSRTAFERDHLRDSRLRLAGYEVLRFTWRQLQDEPAMVIALLRKALRAHPGPTHR